MAAPDRVDWSPRALRDLIAIYRITAADYPRAAAEQGEHIIERAEALAACFAPMIPHSERSWQES